MKKFRRLICLMLAVTMMGGIGISQPVQAEEVVSQENVQNPEEDKLNEWLSVCEEMGLKLKQNRFSYGKYGNKSTYQASKANGRKANCAAYVSWCLQEFGILKKGQTFYAKRSGAISRRFKSWKNKVSIIRVYKKPASASLQPGDIVCWKGIVHVNIYAGKNAKGQRLWYDGGSAGCIRGRVRYYTSAHQKKVFNYLDKYQVSYIIRIKGLK